MQLRRCGVRFDQESDIGIAESSGGIPNDHYAALRTSGPDPMQLTECAIE